MACLQDDLIIDGFQHTAARRRLALLEIDQAVKYVFQHTAARRRLVAMMLANEAKAEFQHTAARRRLVRYRNTALKRSSVSTHSRPKAAGSVHLMTYVRFAVSTHSRPKAAGASF